MVPLGRLLIPENPSRSRDGYNTSMGSEFTIMNDFSIFKWIAIVIGILAVIVFFIGLGFFAYFFFRMDKKGLDKKIKVVK